MASSGAPADEQPPPSLMIEEREKHASLLAALRESLDMPWIGQQASLTILFCSKLDVQEAVKKYLKWVKMLKSFGFTSLAEVFGPTATAHMEGDDGSGTSGRWADHAD